MEALGAASSVFAVVSLAVQLGSNIKRLADFWDSVKEAPAEVEQIKLELIVLESVLGLIAKDAQRSTADGDIAHQFLGIFTRSVVNLEKLSKEFDRGLNGNGTRRKWTCLKKALREKKLASYWSEIERAKSMLVMYQCLGNGQRFDSLLELLTDKTSEKHLETHAEAKSEVEYQQRPGNRSVLTKINLGSDIYDIFLSFGTIRIRFRTYSMRSQGEKKGDTREVTGPKPLQRQITTTFFPKFHGWPLLEWVIGHQFNSIKFGLQSFNLQPGTSPIFDSSSRGDLENVRRLIENGLASPNDVDEEGWTPLHHAAAGHHSTVCQILIDMGTISDSLTIRQETPLLLAAKSDCRRAERRPIYDEVACIDTVRVLVERGGNDPMIADNTGFTSVLTAAKNPFNKAVFWLLNQDIYDINLQFSALGGMATSALLARRKDLSSEILAPLLRKGISVNAACARRWRFKHGPGNLTIKEPTMIQYAVWTWYDELLDSFFNDFPWGSPPKVPQRPLSPLQTIKALLDNGGSFYAQSGSHHTILDGLVLNIIQFDSNGRPPDVLAACLNSWLELVQDLGFSVKDYIRIEAAEQKDTYHDLGMGLQMWICFNEESPPHIWTEFQGPHERERGECVDHISKCAIWKEWQTAYTLPKLPFTLTLARDGWITRFKPEMIVIQERTSPDSPTNPATPETEERNGVLGYRRLSFTRICHIAIYHLYFATKYRYEFTFYIAIFTCFFCSWVARFWITTAFFMTLKLLESSIM